MSARAHGHTHVQGTPAGSRHTHAQWRVPYTHTATARAVRASAGRARGTAACESHGQGAVRPGCGAARVRCGQGA
eukprot:5102644-Prymnesium_polylepis.1